SAAELFRANARPAQSKTAPRGARSRSCPGLEPDQKVELIDWLERKELIFVVSEPVPFFTAARAATPRPTTAAVSTNQSTVTAPSSSLLNFFASLNSFMSLSVTSPVAPSASPGRGRHFHPVCVAAWAHEAPESWRQLGSDRTF